MAYVGNVVDLWERLADEGIHVDLGSDQTSLHNPWAGGYYPVGYTLEESQRMMAEEPERFKEAVQASLRRQVAAINRLADRGMYFFDYGNAFLLEAGRAKADVFKFSSRPGVFLLRATHKRGDLIPHSSKLIETYLRRRGGW